jgi:hypothetical protein
MKNEFKRKSVRTPTEVRYSIKREHSFKDGVHLRKSRHIDDFFIVSQISKRKKKDFFKEIYDCEEQNKIPTFQTQDDEDVYLKKQDSHIKDFIKKYLHDHKDAKEISHKHKQKRQCSHSDLNTKLSNSQICSLQQSKNHSPRRDLRKNSFDNYSEKDTNDIKLKKKRKEDVDKEGKPNNNIDNQSKDLKDINKKIQLNTCDSNNDKQKKKTNNQDRNTIITPGFKTIESSKNLARNCLYLENDSIYTYNNKDEIYRTRDVESTSFIANFDNSSHVNNNIKVRLLT